jgi:hypothetical protein
MLLASRRHLADGVIVQKESSAYKLTVSTTQMERLATG